MHNRFAVFSSASNKSYNGQLARAMAKLDYDDMKKRIQKVFGDTVGGSGDTLPIKSEECLFTYRGRGNSYRGRSRSSFLPRIVNGKRLQCFVCQSNKHFATRCPQRKTTEEAQMSINIT